MSAIQGRCLLEVGIDVGIRSQLVGRVQLVVLIACAVFGPFVVVERS